MLDFITGNSGSNYVVVDLSGISNPPYTGKQCQITAFDGTLIYDSGVVPITQNNFSVLVDSSWTTHLALVQILVNVFYFKGSNSETVSHNYASPTITNTKLS